MRARKGTLRLTQRYLVSTDMEGLVMTNRRGQKTTAMREVLASNDVRTLIATQLGVDVIRVTDDHLGADGLDRVELMTCDRRSVRGRRNHARGCRPDRSRRRSNPPHRKD